MNTIKTICSAFTVVLLAGSCTKLNEEFRSNLEQGNTIQSSQLLVSAYNTLNGPYQQGDRWCLQELSSDEAIAPT
ncbi:MAG: RagB/SusD family nutrient uptake outer membrane protein, partial [Chitinophagaceae bacterium]